MTKSARFFIAACVLTLALFGSANITAQESAAISSIRDQLIQLSRFTDKELMIKQNLANVRLNEEQLSIIDQQGYIEHEEENNVVISSLGGDVICYIDTRFLISKDVHYDADNDVLIGQFQPDKNASNIMCNNFSDTPEAMYCSVKSDGKTTRVIEEKLAQYYELCVHQMIRVLNIRS